VERIIRKRGGAGTPVLERKGKGPRNFVSSMKGEKKDRFRGGKKKGRREVCRTFRLGREEQRKRRIHFHPFIVARREKTGCGGTA